KLTKATIGGASNSPNTTDRRTQRKGFCAVVPCGAPGLHRFGERSSTTPLCCKPLVSSRMISAVSNRLPSKNSQRINGRGSSSTGSRPPFDDGGGAPDCADN